MTELVPIKSVREIPNEHWLYPFIPYIVEFNVNYTKGNWYVKIATSREKLSLDLSKIDGKMMRQLGINQLDIETPVEKVYHDWDMPGYRHTGDIIISMEVEGTKHIT